MMELLSSITAETKICGQTKEPDTGVIWKPFEVNEKGRIQLKNGLTIRKGKGGVFADFESDESSETDSSATEDSEKEKSEVNAGKGTNTGKGSNVGKGPYYTEIRDEAGNLLLRRMYLNSDDEGVTTKKGGSITLQQLAASKGGK